MTKRASPGVGHNSGAELPKHGNLLYALAMEVLDQEELAAIRERRKRHRKGAEGKGITMEDLDRLYKMKDMTEDETEYWFRRTFNALTAVFTGLAEQFDLFRPKPSAPERRAAHRHTGFMCGVQGKPANAPPNISGDDLQSWLEGHATGADARMKAKSDRMDEIAEALKNAEKGITTDGTGKAKATPTPEQVREQARKDFEEDNPDLKPKQDEKPPEKPADDFEATPEELAAQQGRKKQEAETPDPAQVAKDAEKVKRSGFVDRKAKAK